MDAISWYAIAQALALTGALRSQGAGMRQIALIILFWVALAFTLTMAWLPHPPSVPGNPSDKVQHIAAFACLSLAGAMAFPNFPVWRLGERLSFLGAMIELVQSIPALHRDCDIRDWLADTIAIAIVLLSVASFRQYRRTMAWRDADLRSGLRPPGKPSGLQAGSIVSAPDDPMPGRGE